MPGSAFPHVPLGIREVTEIMAMEIDVSTVPEMSTLSTTKSSAFGMKAGAMVNDSGVNTAAIDVNGTAAHVTDAPAEVTRTTAKMSGSAAELTAAAAEVTAAATTEVTAAAPATAAMSGRKHGRGRERGGKKKRNCASFD